MSLSFGVPIAIGRDEVFIVNEQIIPIPIFINFDFDRGFNRACPSPLERGWGEVLKVLLNLQHPPPY